MNKRSVQIVDSKILKFIPHLSKEEALQLMYFGNRVTRGDFRDVFIDTRGEVEQADNDDRRIVSVEKAVEYLNKRIEAGHLGCLEHIYVSAFVRCSRVCARQWMRHRLASYMEVSQRYAAINEVIDAGNEMANGAMREALWAYNVLREAGLRKEDARFVAPGGAATYFLVTMNGRSWRHFIEMRLDKAAQWEIRRLAEQAYDFFLEYCPLVVYNIRGKEGN